MTICPHEPKGLPDLFQTGICSDHVTLDLDGTTKPPKKYYIYGAENDSDTVRCVHWRLSSGRKGIHIIICTSRDLTDLEKFLFRLWNHDDIWRLSYDVVRYDKSIIAQENDKGYQIFATGTLFDMKRVKGKNREVSEWQ